MLSVSSEWRSPLGSTVYPSNDVSLSFTSGTLPHDFTLHPDHICSTVSIKSSVARERPAKSIVGVHLLLLLITFAVNSARMTTIKEATFRHQFLTTDKVEVLLAQLHNLKALNLSQNKMNMLPRGIPSSLIALDLSYNLFATFPSSEKLHNLMELKLSNNSIERFVEREFYIISNSDCNVWHLYHLIGMLLHYIRIRSHSAFCDRIFQVPTSCSIERKKINWGLHNSLTMFCIPQHCWFDECCFITVSRSLAQSHQGDRWPRRNEELEIAAARGKFNFISFRTAIAVL